jgi:hypothetical protein
VRKCVRRLGISVGRRVNQCADRSVRSLPFDGIPCGGQLGPAEFTWMSLTLSIITSYAEMRSDATKRRVFESTS